MVQTQDRSLAAGLIAARSYLKENRARGWEALNHLFRNAAVPDPAPNGRYRGEFIALALTPGLTQLFGGLASLWMPWQGKTFSVAQQHGENVLSKGSYFLARVFNPFYRGFRSDTPKTYRAFAFRTYAAPGLFDEDLTVLKIDYDLKENPALTVRRVLDELVQLDDGLFLGKAHVRWWWGRWQTVAYFSLKDENTTA